MTDLRPSVPEAITADLDGLLRHLSESREYHLREAEKFQRQRYINGFCRAKSNADKLEKWIEAIRKVQPQKEGSQ